MYYYMEVPTHATYIHTRASIKCHFQGEKYQEDNEQRYDDEMKGRKQKNED